MYQIWLNWPMQQEMIGENKSKNIWLKTVARLSLPSFKTATEKALAVVALAQTARSSKG